MVHRLASWNKGGGAFIAPPFFFKKQMAEQRKAIRRHRALACVALLAGGCTSSVEQNTRSAPFSYQEQTVSTFMSECMSELTIEQCLCVLDRFRGASSEAAYVALRDGDRYRNFFRAHAMACGAPRTLAAESGSQSPVAVSSAAAVSSSPAVALPPVPAERKATNAEVCLQERLAAASAKAPDGSVPLEEFDRIKKECGM